MKKQKGQKQAFCLKKFFDDFSKPGKSILENSLKFLVLFFVLFFAADFLLSLTNVPNMISTESSSFLLNLANVKSAALLDENGYYLDLEKFQARILDLCSGKLEIALLFAIIFASFEKTLAYRLKGFAIALIFTMVFNSLRIFLSVFFAAQNALAISTLFHDFLFRISLIFSIVILYAAWYYFDYGKEESAKTINKTKKEKNAKGKSSEKKKVK